MKTILGLSLCPMGCWALPNRLVLAKEGQVKGDLVLGQAPTGWPEPLGHTPPLFGMQFVDLPKSNATRAFGKPLGWGVGGADTSENQVCEDVA